MQTLRLTPSAVDQSLPKQNVEGLEATGSETRNMGLRRRSQQCCSNIHWNLVVAATMFVSRFCFESVIINYSLFFIPIQEEFGSSALVSGWVGALALGTRKMFAPPVTSFGERYGFKKVYIVGVILCSVSMLASSFAPSVYWLFMTHGLLYGIGHSMSVYAPIIFTLSCFQENKSASVTGFLALATSAAIMAFAPIIALSNEALGWRNTLRIFFAVCLVVGLTTSTVMSPSFQIMNREYREAKNDNVDEKTKTDSINETDEGDVGDYGKDTKVAHNEKCCSAPSDKRDARDHIHDNPSKYFSSAQIRLNYKEVLCSVQLWLQGIAALLACLGITFTYVNTVSYFDSIGIENQRSAFMVSMMGVSELVGTVIVILCGDRWPYSKMEVLMLTNLIMATTQGALTSTSSYTAVFACAIITAVCRGMYNAMVYPACVQTFGPGLRGTSCGLMSFYASFGFLSGAALGGYIFDITGSYHASFFLLLGVFLFATVLYAVSAFLYRWKLRAAVKARPTRYDLDDAINKPTKEEDKPFILITESKV